MSKKRVVQQYEVEFKLDAVRLVEECGASQFLVWILADIGMTSRH